MVYALYVGSSSLRKLYTVNMLGLIGIIATALLHSSDLVVARISQERHVQNRHGLEEFCSYETFQPECWKSEVIVIQEAIYGRRQVGRCIEAENSDLAEDPRYLGCHADVLYLLDAKCSGKKECELRIPDPDLERATSCVKSLKMFLEVRYTCVEVVEADRSCVVSVTSNPLHIAAAADADAGVDSWSRQSNIGCGTKTQPWMLEAPAGQRINISLLDFTAAARGLTSQHLSRSTSHIITATSSSGSCVDDKRQYGYIIDKSSVNKKNVSVCHARFNRQTHVHLSASNTLQLVLTSIDHNRDNFLLRVEVVGCSNLVPPDDAWMRRSGDKLVIGCYTSRQTWQLRCQHRRWVGVLSNCTTGPVGGVPAQKESKETLMFDEYQVLAIVAVSSVGLAICLTIICCGIFCLRRYSYDSESTMKSGIKYNVMSDPMFSQTGGGRGQLQPGNSGYDDVKRINNGNVSNGRCVGGPQYFVLDQEYMNNRQDVVSS